MNNDTIAMLIVLPLVGLMMLALTIGCVLVIRDTVRRRGKWGINLKTVYCPECGKRAPLIRDPRNWRQMLWGGWTCARCGVEFDKWGREVEGEE
jgi:hypothetical protein